jgi:hypothetical protein
LERTRINATAPRCKRQVPVNLEIDQTEELRELALKTHIPQQVLIRQGISMVLKKYRGTHE